MADLNYYSLTQIKLNQEGGRLPADEAANIRNLGEEFEDIRDLFADGFVEIKWHEEFVESLKKFSELYPEWAITITVEPSSPEYPNYRIHALNGQTEVCGSGIYYEPPTLFGNAFDKDGDDNSAHLLTPSLFEKIKKLIQLAHEREINRLIRFVDQPAFADLLNGNTVISHHGIWSVEDIPNTIDKEEMAQLTPEDCREIVQQMVELDLDDLDWDRLATVARNHLSDKS